MQEQPLNSVLDAMQHTPLVRLDRLTCAYGVEGTILAKLDYLLPGSSKKDRAAKGVIEAAEASGHLHKGQTVVELTSEARKEASIIRGEADGKRNKIYAEAFGRDPEFFAFSRSLTSYERALQGDNTSMVMQPDSAFFEYLRQDQKQ